MKKRWMAVLLTLVLVCGAFGAVRFAYAEGEQTQEHLAAYARAFDGIDKSILCFLLLPQGFHDILVNCALCNNVMNDDRICLTLPVKSCVGLLI